MDCVSVVMAIPKNAVITNAYIQFTSKEVTTATCNLEIRGDASDNSSAFAVTPYNVSARTKTSAVIYWTPPAWNTVYAATPDQQTPGYFVYHTGDCWSKWIYIVICHFSDYNRKRDT